VRDAGLFRIMQPAVYGGYEYGFDALVNRGCAGRRGLRLVGQGTILICPRAYGAL
jgi:hypothetical protein